MISIWSLFSATVWFVLAFFLLFLLRGHTSFLMHHGTTAWSVAVVLTIVRLLLPLDSEHMIVLRSYTVLLSLNNVLRSEPLTGVSIQLILAGVWVVGAVVGIALIVCGVVRDRKRLDKLSAAPITPQVQTAIQACGIDPGIVCVAPTVTVPFSAGFLHPKIYLPDLDYPEADLVWILKHEVSHINGHDAWWRLGFLLFRCFFWWNPLTHLAQKTVNDVLELRCDKNVLSGVTAAERMEYGQVLSRVARQTCLDSRLFVGAGAFVHPRQAETLALRVRLALDMPKRRDWVAVFAVILSLTLFIGSYCFILQPAGAPPELENGEGVYRISEQTSYLTRLPSGDYELWCNGKSFGIVHADDLQDEMYQGLEVLQ